MAGGFLSPAFPLGLAAGPPPAVQGGFVTVLPFWRAGGGVTPTVQGGFLTVLPFWRAGGGVEPEPVPERRPSGGMRGPSERFTARLAREDDEILAIIMAAYSAMWR